MCCESIHVRVSVMGRWCRCLSFSLLNCACRQLQLHLHPGVTGFEIRLPRSGPLRDGDVVQHLGVTRHDGSLVFEVFAVSQEILTSSEVLGKSDWFVMVVLDDVRYA